MTRLSKRERMMAGTALLAGAVAGGYLYVVEPRWTEIKHLEQNRIPAREQVLAKARARIAQRPSVQAQLTEVSQAVEALSTRLLPSATPPLAASELQKLVKELAVEAGVEVRTERILQPVERGDLLEIPVEITVAGRIREMVAFFYQLEETTKFLVLQDLRVRVVSVAQPRDLLTTLTVSGFILSSGPPQKVEKPPGSVKGS